MPHSPDTEFLVRDEQAVRSNRLSVEARAGIDNLDWLQAERRRLYREEGYGDLRAMYGPFGRWDELRKSTLEALKLRVFSPLEGDPKLPERTTDKLVDAWAHAHPEYVTLLHNARVEMRRYILLGLQVQEIEEQIASRISELSFSSAELRLTPR